MAYKVVCEDIYSTIVITKEKPDEIEVFSNFKEAKAELLYILQERRDDFIAVLEDARKLKVENLQNED